MNLTPKTMIRQHDWVKHTITRVSVLPDLDDDQKVVIIEDPEATQSAEEQAVYGCNNCGLPMAGNTDTLCEGELKDA